MSSFSNFILFWIVLDHRSIQLNLVFDYNALNVLLIHCDIHNYVCYTENWAPIINLLHAYIDCPSAPISVWIFNIAIIIWILIRDLIFNVVRLFEYFKISTYLDIHKQSASYGCSLLFYIHTGDLSFLTYFQQLGCARVWAWRQHGLGSCNEPPKTPKWLSRAGRVAMMKW